MKNEQNIQQLVRGFKTVEIYPSPLTVRVHEAMDASYVGNKHRYFVSVDLKFREMDALYAGELGYFGMTKSEATDHAKSLASRIYATVAALTAAEEAAKKIDTFTNRLTVKVQSESLKKIVSKYTAEIINVLS